MTNPSDNLKETDDLIRFARAYCAERLPWFAPALFQCNIQITKKVPLAAIDQHLNVYFNPDSVQKIAASGDTQKAISELGFVWIHEISHILREHGDRAKVVDAQHMLWNVAADLEINDSKWEGLQAPEIFPLLYPETYKLPKGQLTEFYYQQLKKQEKERKEKETNNSKDDSSNDGNASDTPSTDTPDSTPPPPPEEKNQQHDEGSGVHGQSRPWEVDGEKEDQTAPTKVEEKRIDQKQHKEAMEVEMIRKEVAKAMKDHKDQGAMPGSWERWAEEQTKSTINWKQVLKHRMNIAVNKGMGSRVDYSYKRPGRRQSSYPNIILPALRGAVSASIACVVDTSGSIKNEELSQIVGEVLGVLKAYQCPITIIPCDAKAYAPIEIAIPADIIKLKKLPGGGGTNMIVGIEAALALKQKPDCVLVLTDGFTPYPKKLYDRPVLFGLLQKKGKIVRRPPNPPWRTDLVIDVIIGNK